MAKKASKEPKTMKIKYVRSAIGRDFHQKRVVKGLGFTKLNQVVERHDTPEIRGMVAKICHLVEIVEE
jgi:large subunit ribosomal protein L30